LVRDTGSPPFVVGGNINICGDSVAVKPWIGRGSLRNRSFTAGDGRPLGLLRPLPRRVR
jgi:hypothetical protein